MQLLNSLHRTASQADSQPGIMQAMGMPSNTDRESGTLGRRQAQQAPRRGRLFHLFWPVTSYVVTNVTVTLFWLVFFVFNRTVVIGRRNVGEERNTLLLSNHQSMLADVAEIGRHTSELQSPLNISY